MDISEVDLVRYQKLNRSEALSLSNEEKCKYFYSLQVRHLELGRIGSDLKMLLNPYNETNIIGIIGPTGVGKTMLSKRLMRALIETFQTDGFQDASAIPFIFIPAPANGDKSLSWATFYTKALAQANEILIDKKQANIIKDGTFSVQPKRYKTLAALRDSLESMLKNRKVKVLLIDEAYHMLRFENYSAVMDTLKSIADNSEIKLILLGTYDLFDLLTEYGQVARRAEILHFRRYDKDQKKDQAEFASIIKALETHWPCQDVPAFSAISDELMEASLGIVGLLKAIMLRSLPMQLENKGKWNPLFLVKSAKALTLLEQIKKEIKLGEEKVKGATYGESLFSGEFMDKVVSKMNHGQDHAHS